MAFRAMDRASDRSFTGTTHGACIVTDAPHNQADQMSQSLLIQAACGSETPATDLQAKKTIDPKRVKNRNCKMRYI